MVEFKIRYYEPLLREAVRAFVLRLVARRFGLPFFAILAAFSATVAVSIYRGKTDWLTGASIATIGFVGLFALMLYLAQFRNTVGRFRQMRSPEASFGYDEKGFAVRSELGSATLPWSSITEVWRFPRFWILVFASSQFVTLPVDCLDEAAREFITRKTDPPGD